MSGWDQRYDTERWASRDVPLIADRAVMLVGCILLVLCGVGGTVLLADQPESGPSYRPLACTMPEGGL